MKSMTGYGRGSAQAEAHGVRIEVEITSVNRKTLDTQINAPRDWNGFEAKCNKWLKDSFQRGRVHLIVKVESTEGTSTALPLNSKEMDETVARFRKYAEERGIEFVVDGHLLLDLVKTQKGGNTLPDWRAIESELQSAIVDTLSDIDSMRTSEGAALVLDLQNRIKKLRSLVDTVANSAGKTVERYRDLLFDRLKQLDLELDLSDERVLKEIAIFADRSDVSEELTRLNSHFDQFDGLLSSSEASGRKMDFLCQEIHREFNTTGSKSTQIEITRAVIDGKNELERIREQVQNIE